MIDLFRSLCVAAPTLGIYMLLYRLFIQKHCSFNSQRLALLLIVISLFALPFIQLNKWMDWTPDLFLYIIEIPDFGYFNHSNTTISTLPAPDQSFDWEAFWLMIYNGYWIGVVVMLSRFAMQMVQLCRDILTNPMVFERPYKYVLLDEPDVASAFMNYIFISKNIWHSEDNLPIVQHEQVHVQQWHSIDRILAEMLCVFQWFNPFIFWFRKDLIEVHEYLADEKMVVDGIDPIDYQQLIVKYASASIPVSFRNQFNHSLTLKRITMIAQYNNLKTKPFYRLILLLPIFLGAVCLLSFQQPKPVIETGSWILPISKGSFGVSAGYGLKMHPIKKIQKMHTGIDFVAKKGTAVLAVDGGKVVRIERKETGYGNNIVLAIDEETNVLYAHLTDFAVEVGDLVEQGRIIGTVGNTGASTKPHLHFEVIENGKKVNPKNRLPTIE